MRKKLTIPQNKRNHLKGWEAMGMIQANGKKNRGRVKPTPVFCTFLEICSSSPTPLTNRGVQMTKINPTSIYR